MATTSITYSDFQNIALAISGYVDEGYTTAKRINDTAIVGGDPQISVDGESFIGQLRWFKPLDAKFNTASLNDPTEGVRTGVSTQLSNYIKCVRTLGSEQVNLQEIVSGQNGLAKIARDWNIVRANHEDQSILSVFKGITAHEVSRGTGITGFDQDVNAVGGLFVDLNAAGAFGPAATDSTDARRLIDSDLKGAARAERLFRAIGMGFKDHEPDYMYMITSPEILADLRSSNLVDETVVTEGNMTFNTIFGGKFRLLLTRSVQGNFSASPNVNAMSTKTTLLVKPGAISFTNIPIRVPVEIQRSAAKYTGGGSTDIWYRFGFVAHPEGYDWTGDTQRFADNADLAVAGAWNRKYDYLNLNVLPIFHS